MEKEKTFEELMKNLEEITEKLEKDNLNLDESVELFEKGMKTSKECNKKLQDAEKRITMLVDTDNLEEEDFNVE